MDYLKIKGLSGVVLKDAKPLPGKEYLVALRVELEGITKDLKDEDNPNYTYLMTYLSTESLQEIGSSKKLKVESGKTPSQRLRYLIETLGVQLGEDRNEFYVKEMERIISEYAKKINA